MTVAPSGNENTHGKHVAKTIHFSICSSNYLAYARTLFASLRAADPSAEFVLFLADEVRGHYDVASLGFEVVESKDIGIDCFADMAFRYDVMEFNTAIKPFCIRWLFEQRGAGAAIYLDPDLYVLRPLTHVHAALDAGHDIVLTPHACAPLDDGGDPDDIRILRTGAYNLGFGAFADTPSTRRLIDWWSTHLKGSCVVDLEAGLFVDQKFMDLAPCLVESACILRHPGYNTAYWNLMHRPVTRGQDGWLAAGQDLHFLHFSGVVPGRRDVFSKHQNRYTARNIGELAVLLREYLGHLETNDHLGDVRFSRIPYRYGEYLDGTPIAKEFRLIYRRHRLPGQQTPMLALFTADLDLYLQPVPGLSLPGEPVINLLMHQVWSDRSDLQLAFDLNTPVDRWRFAEWFVTSGRRERQLPERCYEVVESSIRTLRAAQQAAQAAAPAAAPAPVAEAPRASLKVRLSKRALDIAPRVRGLWVGLPQPMRQAVKRALVSGAGMPLLEHEIRPGRTTRKVQPAQTRLRDPNLQPGISLLGYLHAESGVGEGARRAARAITAAGIPCAAHVLTTGGVFDEDEAFDAVPIVRGPSPHRIALMHVNADQTAHLPRVVDTGLLRGKYRIGYWAWELAKFPEAWRPAFDEVDEIWTPSEFVAAAVRGATGKTVRVMPHPVPLPPPARFGRSHFGLPADVPLLLTTFDSNSYVGRKNPLAAVRAFRDAFPQAGGDGPHLVVKMHGRLNRGEEVDLLMAAVEADPRIHLIDRVLSRDELASLQQAADAFISLHRSEGFGLNIAECMAAGKVVIATAYGGNTDFCTTGNAYLVSHTTRALQPDDYPHAEGQHWAEPDHDQAVAAVRAALGGGAQPAALAAAARATMADGYSFDAIGRRIAAAIRGV